MLVAQDQNFLPDKVATANAVVHEDQWTQSQGHDQWWLIGLQQEKERIRQLLRDPSIIQRLQWLSRQPQRETEQLRRLHFGEECFRTMARKQHGEHERYLRDVDQMLREILAAIEKNVRVKTELVPYQHIIGVAESTQRPRRGPARGTVDRFRESDRVLYPEIERMIHGGRMTVHAAALKLAHESKGQIHPLLIFPTARESRLRHSVVRESLAEPQHSCRGSETQKVRWLGTRRLTDFAQQRFATASSSILSTSTQT